MTMLHLNLCYNQVCYKETAIYSHFPYAQHFFTCVEDKVICDQNDFEPFTFSKPNL